LQGDVGSGKTAVAMLAMADAVEAGGQAVLMAPTEILARQHYATIEKMAAAAGIEVVVLTARAKGRNAPNCSSASPAAQAQIIDRHPCAVSGHRWCTGTSPWLWSTSSTGSACISGCA
jgi:ATP-dependent DNA helicase RecG